MDLRSLVFVLWDIGIGFMGLGSFLYGLSSSFYRSSFCRSYCGSYVYSPCTL